MKKTITIVGIIITFFIVYFLQANFFSWFTIAKIKPNLFIILVLFVGLFAGKKIGVVLGFIFGIILDLIIGRTVGMTGILLAFVGYLGEYFDKNFSKDSRIVILLIGAFCTIIYGALMYILQIIFLNVSVEVFSFVKILTIETIYNILIITIIYPIMKNVGYEVESEIKGDKILTRYF